MVFLSPIPNCKDLDLAENAPHSRLEIAAIQVLPPEDFREDTWQAHMLTGKIGPSTDYLKAIIVSSSSPPHPEHDPQ